MAEHLRGGDVLARLGGDEFGVLAHDVSLDSAQALAERLRTRIEGLIYVWEQRSYTISASIGVVMIDRAGMTLDDVLAHADAACYMAKDHGRNRIHFYSAQDDETVRRRGEMEWANRLRWVIDEGRLLLDYQEVLPLQEQPAQAHGGPHIELLIRLRDEDGRIVAPGAFLPAAERYGMMPALDRWVIGEAIAHFDQLACQRARAGTLLAQPRRIDAGRRRPGRLRARPDRPARRGAVAVVLRDHRNRSRAQPRARGAGDGAVARGRLPGRARRFRRRHVLVRIPQEPAGGRDQDRRQLHPRARQRSDEPFDRRRDHRDRPPARAGRGGRMGGQRERSRTCCARWASTTARGSRCIDPSACCTSATESFVAGVRGRDVDRERGAALLVLAARRLDPVAHAFHVLRGHGDEAEADPGLARGAGAIDPQQVRADLHGRGLALAGPAARTAAGRARRRPASRWRSATCRSRTGCRSGRPRARSSRR